MPDYKVECVLRFDAEVGEGPAWCVEDRSLYWIDIHKCSIHRFDPRSGENKTWKLPAMPGCFVFREGGGALIPARSGIYEIDFVSGETKLVLKPPYDPDLYRFNDGKCDRSGRLWVGTMPVELSQIGKLKGALYCFDGKSIDSRMEIEIANGLAFDADGQTMYRAETSRRVVYVYDFDDARGKSSNERVFARWERGFGAPDGATVDTAGGYWVALPSGDRGGSIARFAPDGALDVHIEMPVPAPTMVAFGGPNMSTLYITSGRFRHLADRPGSELSGSLFAIETDFEGRPEPKFKGTR